MFQKYVAKQLEVEAFQFNEKLAETTQLPGVGVDGGGYYVTTVHGNEVYLEAGDWVIKEPGDWIGVMFPCYPVKNKIFVHKYLRLEPDGRLYDLVTAVYSAAAPGPDQSESESTEEQNVPRETIQSFPPVEIQLAQILELLHNQNYFMGMQFDQLYRRLDKILPSPEKLEAAARAAGITFKSGPSNPAPVPVWNAPAVQDWKQYFTVRELKQIRFSQIYFNEFTHGADGHNNMVIIAKLVGLLEDNAPPVPQEIIATEKDRIEYIREHGISDQPKVAPPTWTPPAPSPEK